MRACPVARLCSSRPGVRARVVSRAGSCCLFGCGSWVRRRGCFRWRPLASRRLSSGCESSCPSRAGGAARRLAGSTASASRCTAPGSVCPRPGAPSLYTKQFRTTLHALTQISAWRIRLEKGRYSLHLTFATILHHSGRTCQPKFRRPGSAARFMGRWVSLSAIA